MFANPEIREGRQFREPTSRLACEIKDKGNIPVGEDMIVRAADLY